MSHDIDSLVEASRMVTSKSGEHDLWKVVMRLPQWYFLANPGPEGDVQPLIAPLEGRPSLIAFTEEERAEAWSRHRAEKTGSERMGVLHMDIADAVGYGQMLVEHGVEAIYFNDGLHGFGATMTELRHMHGQYGG